MSEIVPATSAEQIEQVRNLFAEYRAQLPVEYCFRTFDAEIAGLPGVYAPPEGLLLLATVIGQPVGCVGLRPFPREGTCEMKRLYTSGISRRQAGEKAGGAVATGGPASRLFVHAARFSSSNHAGRNGDVPQAGFPRSES